MNDIRRTILWVVFGFSLVMLWDQWQISKGQKPTFFPSPVTNQSPSASAGTSAASANSTPAPVAQAPVGQPPVSAPTQDTAKPATRIEVQTDVLRLVLSSEGASVVRAELLQHQDAHRPGSHVVVMDDSTERVYLAQSGLIGAPNGGTWPTHKTPMVFSGAKTLQEIGRAHV